MRASHRLLAGSAVAAIALAAGYAGVSTLTAPAVAADAATSGLRVDNFRLADNNLFATDLYRLADAKAVVIITQATGDATLKAQAATLKSMIAAYKDKGVEFRLLNSTLGETREAINAEMAALGIDTPVLIDANQLVGEQLNVQRSAEVIVINPKTWTVAWRGALNPAAPQAVDALVNGRPITAKAAAVAGKAIAFPERAKKASFVNISYADTVAPIIKEKCAECHQPGGIGPMALNTYEQIKGFAPMIRETLRGQRMPPYHADPMVGHFSDGKALSPTQIKTLVHWIEAGAPRGKGVDPLASVKFQAPDWPLGKPDLILDIPAYNIPATGIVDYQNPYAVNPLTEGRWLRASTIKVNERQAVHHILTGYLSQVPGPGQQSQQSRWGTSVGGYAVGAESQIQPANTGVFLPAGGAVGFQNHYTPFGKPVTDKSQIAFYFYPKDKNPELVMRNSVIADQTIQIAPNTEHHREVAYATFPADALLFTAFPHAHYRGNSAKLDLITPDGKRTTILALPKYDFNWQREYTFAEPIKIPAGSRLVADYTFDNTKRNPANPDPNRVVPWGDQSFDEMLYMAIRYRWVGETSSKLTNNDALLNASRAVGMMDDNIDGKLQLAELKGRAGQTLKASFPLLDANKDGGLDEKEMAAAQNRGPQPAPGPRARAN